MKPDWMIEANVEGLPSEALQAEIRRQGMIPHVVKPFLHSKFPEDILGSESIPLDANVIFTGTLPLMRYIQKNRRWKPGGWCTFANLACSTYYAYFGEFLLNRSYAMLPIAEAIRRRTDLFTSFGREGQLFVRPNSVDKSFEGKLVGGDDFAEFLKSNAFDPTLLIVVATPQTISVEWRLFVANGRVIAGSQYRVSGRTSVSPECPGHVIDFANSALATVRWTPDPLFVIDVCESADGMKIVELNSFSCSGQCAIDLERYVDVASRHAAAYW